jgi:hypothetical protein
MSRDEFIEHVETLHLQNLSGREVLHKAFQLGIGAAFDEIEELGLFAVVQAKPEEHFCELKEFGRGKRCKEQCEGCNWFEFRNKQK